MATMMTKTMVKKIILTMYNVHISGVFHCWTWNRTLPTPSLWLALTVKITCGHPRRLTLIQVFLYINNIFPTSLRYFMHHLSNSLIQTNFPQHFQWTTFPGVVISSVDPKLGAIFSPRRQEIELANRDIRSKWEEDDEKCLFYIVHLIFNHITDSLLSTLYREYWALTCDQRH